MNITTLEYFITIAETLHLTRAAEKMNISEPAMSKAISKLEDEIGYRLFDRRGRNIYLNTNGELFLTYAQTAVKTIYDGINKLNEQNALHNEQLTIQSMPLSLFSGLITNILHEFPSAQFKNSFDITTNELEDNLISSKSDLCFTTQSLHTKDINSILLYSDPIILAVSSMHPFHNRKHIKVSELLNETFVKCSNYTTGLDFDYNHVFAKYKAKPQVLPLASNAYESLEYVAANKCVAAIRPTFFNNHNSRKSNGICTIPVFDDDNNPIYCNYRLYYKKKHDNPNIIRLKNIFIDYFSNISKSSSAKQG